MLSSYPSNSSQAMFMGACRFGSVSVLAYGVWALPVVMSTMILYVSIAVVFLLGTGLLMFPLIKSENKVISFYKFFIPAFIAYAILWCAGWFGIRGHAGEIFGSAAGLAVMVIMAMKFFGSKEDFLICLGVLYLFHTLGYTLGSMLSYAAYGRGIFSPIMENQVMLGKLLWGLFYGLGFGAGLGYLLFSMQKEGLKDSQAVD